MNEKNEQKNIVIFIAIVVVLSLTYMVLDKVLNKDQKPEAEFLRNYKVNEYIPVYVTEEDLVKIYFNDYIHTMYLDVEKAYNLLDKEYREKKFGNIENYKNYIKTLTSLTHKVDSFYINDSKKNKIYGVYDTNGNIFIFETDGIMQYKVYLDDYTVEI